MKRIISVLIVVVILTASLSVSAFAVACRYCNGSSHATGKCGDQTSYSYFTCGNAPSFCRPESQFYNMEYICDNNSACMSTFEAGSPHLHRYYHPGCGESINVA